MGTVADTSALLQVPSAISTVEEADQSCITRFHITGFGPFHNVPINPTQSIVDALPVYLSSQPLDPGVQVATTRVLKVAAETCKNELQKMYKLESTVQTTSELPSLRSVFIHLGLNASVSKFQLEIQGRNEATFSCPDEMGWSPIKRPIDDEQMDISTICRTTLRLDAITERLSSQGFDVEISNDAGRFVCNWVYYNSLRLAERTGACALFVHVPPASIVPIEKQVSFIASLLNTIASIK